MSKPSLTAQIAAQERAVELADRRLANRLTATTTRLRTSSSPLRSLGLSVGSLAAGWFFLRFRRRLASAAHPPALAGDRLSLLLNTTLPLLVPVIGMRAVGLLTALASLPVKSSARLPVAAPQVDLRRFSGNWFEIGRIAAPHERRFADDVTTTYLLDDAGMRVINRRRQPNGRAIVTRQRARVVDPISHAKLKVTSAPVLLRWLPMAWSDFWILDVAPDYRYALVGGPERRSLQVLAREPTMPAAAYHALLTRAAALGFDTRRMRTTAQRALS